MGDIGSPNTGRSTPIPVPSSGRTKRDSDSAQLSPPPLQPHRHAPATPTLKSVTQQLAHSHTSQPNTSNGRNMSISPPLSPTRNSRTVTPPPARITPALSPSQLVSGSHNPLPPAASPAPYLPQDDFAWQSDAASDAATDASSHHDFGVSSDPFTNSPVTSTPLFSHSPPTSRSGGLNDYYTAPPGGRWPPHGSTHPPNPEATPPHEPGYDYSDMPPLEDIDATISGFDPMERPQNRPSGVYTMSEREDEFDEAYSVDMVRDPSWKRGGDTVGAPYSIQENEDSASFSGPEPIIAAPIVTVLADDAQYEWDSGAKVGRRNRNSGSRKDTSTKECGDVAEGKDERLKLDGGEEPTHLFFIIQFPSNIPPAPPPPSNRRTPPMTNPTIPSTLPSNRPPRVQQLILKNYIIAGSPKAPHTGDPVYLLSDRWYGRFNTWCEAEGEAPTPGPIDNSSLLPPRKNGYDSMGAGVAGRLKEPLHHLIDYVMVRKEGWQKLLAWHQPLTPRHVIPRIFSPAAPYVLDLYPALLPVIVLLPTADLPITEFPLLAVIVTQSTTVTSILRALEVRLGCSEEGRQARLWKVGLGDEGDSPRPSAPVVKKDAKKTACEVLGVGSGLGDGGWIGVEVSRRDGSFIGDALGLEIGGEGSGIEIRGLGEGDRNEGDEEMDQREVVSEWDGEGSMSPSAAPPAPPVPIGPSTPRTASGAIILGPPESSRDEDDPVSVAGNFFKSAEREEDEMLGRASQRTAADKDDEDLPRGATGLVNLGNTCFMNSSVQCMSATWALTAFFLGPNWRADLNRDNPLGMRGEIAEAYAKLVRELWAEAKEAKKAQSTSRTTSSYFGGGGWSSSSYWSSYSRAVRPSEFKAVMARFNSTFQGYHQHDSQELLASLLDGLHEDLNRVKKKPYVSLPDDISERSDEEAAAISWDVYKARNDSVVVDLFQGQFKSKVTCTVCDGVSVTFDPFMYIAVPVVETKEETKRVIVVGRISRGLEQARAKEIAITLPKDSRIKGLADKLSLSTGWKEPGESTPEAIVWEVYSHKIWKLLDEFDGITEISDSDTIWVYECEPKHHVLIRLGGLTAPSPDEREHLEALESEILKRNIKKPEDGAEETGDGTDRSVAGSIQPPGLSVKRTPSPYGGLSGTSPAPLPLYRTLTDLSEVSLMLRLELLKSPPQRATVNIAGMFMAKQKTDSFKPPSRSNIELFGTPIVMSLPANMWVKVPRFRNSTDEQISQIGRELVGWKLYREFVRQVQRFTQKQIALAKGEQWDAEDIKSSDRKVGVTPSDSPVERDEMDVDSQRLAPDPLAPEPIAPRVRFNNQYGPPTYDEVSQPYSAGDTFARLDSTTNGYYSRGIADPLDPGTRKEDINGNETVDEAVLYPPCFEDPYTTLDDSVVRPNLFELYLIRETIEKDPSPIFNGTTMDPVKKTVHTMYGGSRLNSEYRLWRESADWFENHGSYRPTQSWLMYKEGSEKTAYGVEAMVSGELDTEEPIDGWIDYCVEFRKNDVLVSAWTPRVARELFGDRATFKQYGGRLTNTAIGDSQFPYEPLPRDAKSGSMVTSRGKSLTLHECLREFTKEETLGDEDTWFCPKCKAHQKVRKKMDVWRVPDQVVIHLKRFSNSGMRTYSWARGGDKIDTLVEFPVKGLSLREYVLGAGNKSTTQNTEQETSDSPDPNSNPESDDPVFDLYAVSNHFGGMGGGHYTAYAQSPVDGNWYKFDDSSVSLTSEDNVVTSSAYLLFYRRRGAVLDPPFGQFPETLADATETQTQTLTLTSTSDDVMPGLESSYPPPYTSYIGGDSSGWSRFDSLSGSATPGISITPSISMEENLGSSAAADVIFPGSQGDREVRARAALSRVKGKSVVRTASASADDADADTVWKENETGEMLEQDPHRDEEMASM